MTSLQKRSDLLSQPLTKVWRGVTFKLGLELLRPGDELQYFEHLHLVAKDVLQVEVVN